MSAAGPKSMEAVARRERAIEVAVGHDEVDVLQSLAQEQDLGVALRGDGGRIGQVARRATRSEVP